MAERRLVLTAAEQSHLDLLAQDAARIKMHTRSRNLLIVKLRRAAVPARTIAKYAGATDVSVLMIAKRNEARRGTAQEPNK